MEKFRVGENLEGTIDTIKIVRPIDDILKEEQQKYSRLWSSDYKRSQTALPWAQFIAKALAKETRKTAVTILDVGCGDGTTMKYLNDHGFTCLGVDLTLNGIKDAKEFQIGDTGLSTLFVAPSWKLPFCNNVFDYVISTDVLEHIPQELVAVSILEMYRVARRGLFNCVATWPDKGDHGVDLHLTVKPIDWWRNRFECFKPETIETVKIYERDNFLSKFNNGQ